MLDIGLKFYALPSWHACAIFRSNQVKAIVFEILAFEFYIINVFG